MPEDISLQMATRPISLLSNRESHCGILQVRSFLRIACLTGREKPRVPPKNGFRKLNLPLTILSNLEKMTFSPDY